MHLFMSRAHAAQYTASEDARVCGGPLDVGDVDLRGAGADGGILFCGRITREKGVRTVIEVANAAGVPASFAGEVFDSGLVADIEAAGHRYLGLLPRRRMYEIMVRAGVFLQAQDSGCNEAFGMVAAEALACGLPVVALDRGANAELVGAVDGGSVVPDLETHETTVQALAQAVRSIMAMPAQERALIAARARDRFSASAVLDRLLSDLDGAAQV